MYRADQGRRQRTRGGVTVSDDVERSLSQPRLWRVPIEMRVHLGVRVKQVIEQGAIRLLRCADLKHGAKVYYACAFFDPHIQSLHRDVARFANVFYKRHRRLQHGKRKR